jgi:hypothetical protein
MGKKRKLPKMTPEEHAERDLHQQWLRERIAERLAKQRELDAVREREEK